MDKKIALIGNPNVGKTTLFNLLTGSRQKVGNLCGVTVEKKEGRLKGEKHIKIIDLPGIYSLNAGSEDERVVARYLKSTPPDAIINIVDGTNLERNLYLTEKLKSLSIPIIVAVNMCDEMTESGIKLDVSYLEKSLGVKVVNISAKRKIGIHRLIEEARTYSEKPDLSIPSDDEKIYKNIESILSICLKKRTTKGQAFTLKADRILTHKYWGFPIFVLIITAVYFLSMTVGKCAGDALGEFLSGTIEKAKGLDVFIRLPSFLKGLIFDGVLKGIYAVLTFLPEILVLFFCLSLLEESGYMARVSFLFDRVFRRIGLGGKSVIPLVLSGGCTVTGVMATRTIENKSERIATVFLCPFMPCGAKMAVFAFLSDVLFGDNPFIAVLAYFFGVFAVLVFGRIFKKLNFFRGKSSFILEIPVLRFPKISDVFFVLVEKVKDFLIKAGTVIFAVSVILWLLNNLGINGYVTDVKDSFLYFIGDKIKYVFYPLGFGNWQTSVSLISGILAKEAIMESLSILSSDTPSLFSNPYSVYAFMAFIILSPPCVAALSQIKKELGNGKLFAKMLLFETAAAYFVALIINFFGIIILNVPYLFFTASAVIIILAITVVISGKGCKNCQNCNLKKGGKTCRNRKKRNTTI